MHNKLIGCLLFKQIKNHADNLQNRDESLMEAVTAKTSELCDPEEEYQLLKAAAEMAFDVSHPTEFYLEQLDEQVGAKKHNLVELELQWYDMNIQSIYIETYYH